MDLVISWLAIVSTAPVGDDRNRRRELAREAVARLDELDARLKGGPLSTDDLVALAGKLRAGATLTREQLNQPREFLRWLWPLHEFDTAPELEEILSGNPPRLFHRMISDGRSELPPLQDEKVDEWIHLGNAGDGHQDLFWDPTATDRVRLLWTDNREADVVMKQWTADEYLVQRVFPSLLRCRDDAREAARSEVSKEFGGLAVLLGFGALIVATIALIGGLLWLFIR